MAENRDTIVRGGGRSPYQIRKNKFSMGSLDKAPKAPVVSTDGGLWRTMRELGNNIEKFGSDVRTLRKTQQTTGTKEYLDPAETFAKNWRNQNRDAILRGKISGAAVYTSKEGITQFANENQLTYFEAKDALMGAKKHRFKGTDVRGLTLLEYKTREADFGVTEEQIVVDPKTNEIKSLPTFNPEKDAPYLKKNLGPDYERMVQDSTMNFWGEKLDLMSAVHLEENRPFQSSDFMPFLSKLVSDGHITKEQSRALEKKARNLSVKSDKDIIDRAAVLDEQARNEQNNDTKEKLSADGRVDSGKRNLERIYSLGKQEVAKGDKTLSEVRHDLDEQNIIDEAYALGTHSKLVKEIQDQQLYLASNIVGDPDAPAIPILNAANVKVTRAGGGTTRILDEALRLHSKANAMGNRGIPFTFQQNADSLKSVVKTWIGGRDTLFAQQNSINRIGQFKLHNKNHPASNLITPENIGRAFVDKKYREELLENYKAISRRVSGNPSDADRRLARDMDNVFGIGHDPVDEGEANRRREQSRKLNKAISAQGR